MLNPRRVLLVCMPWAALDMPSLALSTLQPLVAGHRGVASVDICYANLRWADYLAGQTGGRLGERDYATVAGGGVEGLGEWIFSPALHGPARPEDTPFHTLALGSGANLTAAREMFALSPGFVSSLAREIAGTAPDVVGLTSTFEQNLASLALAARLKAIAPDVITILGGANCDGPAGGALLRNFGCLDYVVRGEAEIVLPQLLDVIAGQAAGADPGPWLPRISGLCWRAAGKTRTNPLLGQMVPMDKVPAPSFDAYFSELGKSASCRHVEPKLSVEGSRGCWWGEKHHCTFCGLNGSLMKHRAKPAKRMFTEIADAVARHRTLDVVFADNILDMGYLDSLLPDLGETGWDLQVFFEVKANLGFTQLRRLARAGVTQVQPGIENLSSRVLDLMRKGVSGWQNVRLLRDCQTLGIHPSWNFLYGFPGETMADYAPVIEQIPGLAHLVPPDACTRVRLTRFSPYFDDPALGMVNAGPSRLAAAAYQIPDQEFAEIAYTFESDPSGLAPEDGRLLDRAADAWATAHSDARLIAIRQGEELCIVDERERGIRREFVLDEPTESALYHGLLKGSTADALARRMRVEPDRVGRMLADWTDAGLVYRDGARLVALATGLGWS